MLRAQSEGAFTFEQIVDAVKKASWHNGNTISLDYADSVAAGDPGAENSELGTSPV